MSGWTTDVAGATQSLNAMLASLGGSVQSVLCYDWAAIGQPFQVTDERRDKVWVQLYAIWFPAVDPGDGGSKEITVKDVVESDNPGAAIFATAFGEPTQSGVYVSELEYCVKKF